MTPSNITLKTRSFGIVLKHTKLIVKDIVYVKKIFMT